MIILGTEHLNLIQTDQTHFQHFLGLDLNPQVMQFIRGPAANEEESKIRFKRLTDYNQNHPGYGAFSVFTDAGEFVGLGFIFNLEFKSENKDIEIGYRLLPHFWGQGYATEIAKALIEYGFNELKLTELFGTTAVDHIVSQKVLMKAGMEPMGHAPYYNGCKIFRIKNPA